VLTADASDQYTFQQVPANMAVGALDTSGGNLREAFWPADNPVVNDSESCAIWTSQTDVLVQEGAVLRVTQSGGVTRAISVTKNIWLGAQWIFNFHVWDSTQNPPYTYIGGVDLQNELVHDGVVTPFPWHFCARVIANTVEFKVWPSIETEPAWGDPTHGGHATLPSGWDYAGKAGWYVGHLQPNDAMTYTDLETFKYVQL
jgi:hypothetical protein